MKICSRCPEIGPQPITNFAIKNGKSRNSICKKCKRLYNKNHYQHNKQKYLETNKTRRDDVKRWLWSLKTKLKCNRCIKRGRPAETHPAALTFHHLDPTIKEIGLGNVIQYGWSKIRILKEIDKCECVCASCHNIEHFDN